MSDLILVASSFGREQWAKDCSESLKRPHVVVVERGFEMGKLRWAMETTTADRFVFVQDSVVVTDPAIFDRIAGCPGSICLNHTIGHFSNYAGVYERRVLERVGLAVTPTKAGSVEGETRWTKNYLDWANELSTVTCWGEVVQIVPGTQMRHGRENIVYSTAFWTKYQAEWGQHSGEEMNRIHPEA
ncbi:MAG: hypothetical protein KGI89_16885 [Euryarchaeota archaeon]|nr:hypothetical protein [Euryarchaeota archaeon]